MIGIRGIEATALHGNRRHYYIAVDTTATNWREYVADRVNHDPTIHAGFLHIMDCNGFKELEKWYV